MSMGALAAEAGIARSLEAARLELASLMAALRAARDGGSTLDAALAEAQRAAPRSLLPAVAHCSLAFRLCSQPHRCPGRSRPCRFPHRWILSRALTISD